MHLKSGCKAFNEKMIIIKKETGNRFLYNKYKMPIVKQIIYIYTHFLELYYHLSNFFYLGLT